MNDFYRAAPISSRWGGQHIFLLDLAPASPCAGAFFVVGTFRNLIRLGGKERMPMPETERHRETDIGKKYFETTIGQLRKTYGADFAKGCADNEKLTDVLRKRPSLRNVIREYEAKRFEQI